MGCGLENSGNILKDTGATKLTRCFPICGSNVCFRRKADMYYLNRSSHSDERIRQEINRMFDDFGWGSSPTFRRSLFATEPVFSRSELQTQIFDVAAGRNLPSQFKIFPNFGEMRLETGSMSTA